MWETLTDAQVALLLGGFTTITAIIVGYWQYGKKSREKEDSDKQAVKAETKAEVVTAVSSASETAMATLAERSLALVESLLASEKQENEQLRDLINRLQIDNKDLLISIEKKDQKIADLEKELERLRGRLDALLHTRNDAVEIPLMDGPN